MNRFEQQAEQTRRASLRNSLLLWSAGGILLIAALAVLGYSGGASPGFWRGAAVVAAIMLLVIRHLGRRLRTKGSKAVKPDEQSMLHLE